MNIVVAVLACVVAGLYVLVGAVVVPRLARVAMPGRRSSAVIVGAGTFFVGCVATHLRIAYLELQGPAMLDARGGEVLGRVVPLLAQILGGVAFVVLATRHLQIRVVEKHDSVCVAELEGRLRHALDAGNLGAWGIDLDTGAAWHSVAHDRIFGYEAPPRSWCLDTMLGHVVVDQRDAVRRQLALTAAEPTAVVECQIVSADGSPRWITITGALQCNASGEPTHLIGTVADSTERREREEQRATLEAQLHHWQRVEAVGRLAGGVAHDFNNVLAVVHGWVEVLAGDPTLADSAREPVRAIGAAAQHGRQLTEQLLAVTRERTPGEAAVDVNDTVRDAASMLRRLVPPDVHVHTQLTTTSAIRIDPTHLTQILLNLAINARDAMPSGGEITITTRDTDTDTDSTVEIEVRDNGHGIDPDTLGRLFQPYFTTKDAATGSGLGLSIVETLVQRVHGAITVQSSLGGGATFTLRFPAARADADTDTAAAAAEADADADDPDPDPDPEARSDPRRDPRDDPQFAQAVMETSSTG